MSIKHKWSVELRVINLMVCEVQKVGNRWSIISMKCVLFTVQIHLSAKVKQILQNTVSSEGGRLYITLPLVTTPLHSSSKTYNNN